MSWFESNKFENVVLRICGLD